MTILNNKAEIIIGGTLANYTVSDNLRIINDNSTITGGKRLTPQSLKPIYDSLADENSGRAESGVMHITWVRQKMRKWEIILPPMTSEEMASILSLVQGQVYWLTVYDILLDKEIQLRVYTSKGSGDCYTGVLYDGLWRNFSFSAISTEEPVS